MALTEVQALIAGWLFDRGLDSKVGLSDSRDLAEKVSQVIFQERYSLLQELKSHALLCSDGCQSTEGVCQCDPCAMVRLIRERMKEFQGEEPTRCHASVRASVLRSVAGWVENYQGDLDKFKGWLLDSIKMAGEVWSGQ